MNISNTIPYKVTVHAKDGLLLCTGIDLYICSVNIWVLRKFSGYNVCEVLYVLLMFNKFDTPVYREIQVSSAALFTT